MTWADAGLPGNVTLRPWGKVLYILTLGLQELALAMGVDLLNYTRWIPPEKEKYRFANLRDRFDYAVGYPMWYFNGNPNTMMAYFDSIFRPLVFYSFRAKYCLDHLVYNCTDAQMFGEINDFLGEKLIHAGYDYAHCGEITDIDGGPKLTQKNGYFPRWVDQRYRLIRNMPIYAPYEQLQINAHIDSISDYYFRSGEWTGTVGFQRTWNPPITLSQYYGYCAWSGWNDNVALLSIESVRLTEPEFPFKIKFLHRATINGSDFGTGLQNGQIWTEEISGFGSLNYSYTFPPEDLNLKSIRQESQFFMQVLPQNNPWITGGINV